MDAADYNNLIERIRKEANEVKSCFTTFSFHAIAFGGVVLGGIIAYQPYQPLVGFASIFIIVILLLVCKIGNYKYATSNRHFGFELYLDNKNLNIQSPSSEKYEIGWEQVLRGWRVVQATVFDNLYYTAKNTSPFNIFKRYQFNQIKKEHRDKKPPGGWWFEPEEIVRNNGAKWYPGRYLKTMQTALLLFSCLSLIPLIIIPLQFQFMESSNNYPFNDSYFYGVKYLAWVSGFVAIATTIVLLFKVREINARRELLENGLLNIHSCAIMWEVVILAHKIALDKAKDNQSEYLKRLSEEAKGIIKEENVNDIYKWIAYANNQLRNNIKARKQSGRSKSQEGKKNTV